MRERKIWRLVLWTVAGLGLLAIVMQLDAGFLSLYAGDAVIPIPAGDEIQLTATRRTPLSGEARTTLYRLKEGGAVEELSSFSGAFQCVTSFGGKVFISFDDSCSSIFDKGKYSGSVGSPAGLDIMDVAGVGDKVYAFGLLGGKDRPNDRIGVRLYEGAGWGEPGPPFEAGQTVYFRGCIDVAGGVAVFYGTNEDPDSRPDYTSMKWHYTVFDGKAWAAAADVAVPEGMMPNVSSLDGELAFVLTSIEKGKPALVRVLRSGNLETIAEVPTEGLGRMLVGWLVTAGGKRHLILTGAVSAWDVPMGDAGPGKPVKILAISGASRARSGIYVGLAAVAAVMLVSLGVAWFIVRLRRVRGGGEEG